jgi:S-DNA-T family DNA segregation ATPase FtsK/SpoIIIE
VSAREQTFSTRLIRDAAKHVVNTQSTSGVDLQRRFHIGARKAARLLQVLEDHGVVGPREEGKARDLLVDRTQLAGVLGSLPGPGGDDR